MKHTRFRRRAFLVFLGIVWLAGAGITAAWFQLASSGEIPDSSATVVGLGEPARIDLDGFGIPTISAANELDAWRALGFMHASDRLWQMEYFRRIASGRLAEIFGPQALATDRFTRTLGMPDIASRSARQLKPDEHSVLAA